MLYCAFCRSREFHVFGDNSGDMFRDLVVANYVTDVLCGYGLFCAVILLG